MRYALAWTLVVVGFWTSSAWAQFGGAPGGMGMMDAGGGYGMEGEMEGYGGGFGGGYGDGGYGQEMYGGIRAFGRTATEGAKFQVTWTGPEAAKSQEIYERLSQEPSKVQFIDAPLEEVVGYLKDLHSVSILIDLEAFKSAGLDIELPVTINVTGQTAASTLDLLCDRYKLGWYVDRGILMISSKDDAAQQQSVRIYQLRQLNAAGASQIVTKMIEPGSWEVGGGHGDITAVSDRNLLVIRQNRAGHDATESLLKSLEATK